VRAAVRFAGGPAKLTVRMLSGDHIETATAVARQAGIIGSEDRGKTYTVMHADQFDEMCGGLDRNGQVGDIQTFRDIMQELRVLARARPIHKQMVIYGLK
jgi:Ca2+ transporting ATPase